MVIAAAAVGFRIAGGFLVGEHADEQGVGSESAEPTLPAGAHPLPPWTEDGDCVPLSVVVVLDSLGLAPTRATIAEQIAAIKEHLTPALGSAGGKAFEFSSMEAALSTFKAPSAAIGSVESHEIDGALRCGCSAILIEHGASNMRGHASAITAMAGDGRWVVTDNLHDLPFLVDGEARLRQPTRPEPTGALLVCPRDVAEACRLTICAWGAVGEMCVVGR